MGKTSQIKVDEKFSNRGSFRSDFSAKIRLNLNKLLLKRREEKEVDKKINLIILSGVTAVTVVVIAILSL